MKKKVIIFIVIVIILALAVGGALAYAIVRKNKAKNSNETNVEENQVAEEPKVEKTVQIYKGNERPIAVMIDNHKAALPQAGLNSAYMVYEIIVEGGESRLMALFKSSDTDIVGPVRSSRHYFLDYALENDAIYAHFGWSPQAQSDISSLGVNNINGLYYDGTSAYWRVKDKSAPHNVKASLAGLKERAEKLGYRTTSDVSSVLKYVTDEVNLEDGESAETITIPHSQLQTVKYEYDSENKVYKRYARGVAQKDWDTKDAITIKNLIITYCDNYTLTDTENKGRQGLKNIGTFDGYYITNGKAIKIKCIKEARDSKTIYQDLQGNVIKVNDGNTFVNICPTDAKVTIEGTDLVTNTETTNTVNQ